ncbi:MAG: DUF362 domain-containing protein [Verrucomicrobia bacterium]|nr:DUF362 domain-containing protein [Verrucomicrobiota bacterium]
MEKSKVYFTDMRVSYNGDNLLQKLKKLIKKAGIESIDFKNKFTAIKIHFGEPGNLSYLRPNFAKTVVEVIKAQGGKPFLTDCNTLYVGMRKNALDHLDCAMENGFNYNTCGCQVIIGDGLKGTDEADVPLEGTTFVKSAKIGKAIMDADIIISMNHFKAHEMLGVGGAIKNLGMGCGSRAGKMEQHCTGKLTVDQSICKGCKICAKNCGQNAITYQENGKAYIDQEKCVGCGRCLGACNFDAIQAPNFHSCEDVSMKMAEYAKAVVQNRPHFHISFVMQVSPFCDCHPKNDTAIIPDVGILASFDPVALDTACAELCNKQPIIPGCLIDKEENKGQDYFHAISPATNWKVCLEHAQKIGIGTMDYELIRM